MTRQARGFEELKAGFDGEILVPGHHDYDSARRIWNAMIDRRPAVIARCATTADVVRGVNFARDRGLVPARHPQSRPSGDPETLLSSGQGKAMDLNTSVPTRFPTGNRGY